MPDNSNDPQALPVIENALHDEVLRGLERDEVPMRVRSRLQGGPATVHRDGLRH